MKKKVAGLLFFLCIVFQISAQSSHIDLGDNGPGVEIAFLIGEQSLLRAGGTLGFSIGGRMDIGLLLEGGPGRTSPPDQVYTDFGISYGFMVLKQTEDFPFSFGITSSYGLSNIYSNSLDILREERKGTGWTAGVTLVRDFVFSPVVAWRLGGEFEYRAYRYDTYNMDAPETLISSERVQSFLYGGRTDVIIRVVDGPVVGIGFAVLLDEDEDINFRPSLSFTQPLR